MSTKAIHELIREFRNLSNATTDGWKTGEDEALVQKAMAAVEAIEKAAQDIAAWGDIRHASRDPEEREAVGQAEMLVRRIAQESMP